ncbi:PTS-dependent dihydroxyacetone kinase phosphotransferase subunit DhaM [Atopobacter sp. AH10]|uniref:dihydroxyacetone kinase phosphoryl donor subunit DhaM n=1 Tax=Atopobacter sp. AH10 TaxID=2315861 RepID=UPI000EF25AF6|nr:dihydroxyacetone kinase phosphoryl donor subunit DhaM [Atopobacter sp. AH10]RLK63501.1 PTS-dependent dihydroxyacetone kinase phosphotransferase subunit DhaM [Atopobacter sp. AH10]
MSSLGVVIVSHVSEIAEGVAKLVQQAGPDVSVTYVGGTEDGGIGSSMDRVLNAIESNEKEELLAFFDLGSAKMNLEMAAEFTDKEILVQYVPLVEGSFAAVALIQAGANKEDILAQLKAMTIEK